MIHAKIKGNQGKCTTNRLLHTFHQVSGNAHITFGIIVLFVRFFQLVGRSLMYHSRYIRLPLITQTNQIQGNHSEYKMIS
jgi:hypothetical protein